MLPEAALAAADAALAREPANAQLWNHRGRLLAELGRLDEALSSFERAGDLQPASVEAHNNRGSALRALRRFGEAVKEYEIAIECAPGLAVVHRNRGETLFMLGRYDDALASFDRAVELNARDAAVQMARGATLAMLKRNDEAALAFETAIAIDPAFPEALGQLFQARANLCDWRGRDAAVADLLAAVRAGRRAAAPLVVLAATDSIADQARCARTWSDTTAPARPPLWRGERYAHPRLRIAYLSSDFDDHAVAYLMAGVFELHDRARFEVFALSSGTAASATMRARLTAAFEHFIDVSEHGDRDLAALIRSLEIDIVVDLNGHTLGSRTAALAYRPAPRAASYLGFPGTLSAPYVDYLIADRYVIPPAREAQYAERVIALADVFQANDRKRAIGAAVSRVAVGLPEHGVVLCAFGNSYKITPAMFDVWMRVLAQCEGSVLWLLDGPAALSANLGREAQRRGVDASRLVFAPRLPYAEHLARLRLADLFLDTLPFNGGATVSDALWAGVPVVTCSGEAMAARMAGSLLQAIGMPELVTQTLGDYEAKAVTFARDQEALARLRQKLAANRDAQPLFDTARFCRSLEAAYASISMSSAA